jgi:hypothetical protein
VNTNTLICLLQIAALWVFFVFAVKDYALDRFRQNLFKIRGDLFDKVVEDGGSFSDPTYMNLRDYINLVIRRGHRVSLFGSILADFLSHVPLVTGGVSKQEMRADVETYLKSIEEAESKNEYAKRIRSEIHDQILQYYTLTSPIFIVSLLVALCYVICATGVHGVRKIFVVAFDKCLARDIERGIIIDGLGGQPA